MALVPLALLGWIALAVVLFARLPRPQALVAVFVLGELFLPEVQMAPRVAEMPAALSLPGVKLTKVNAICYAALLASLLFDLPRWRAFRPRWFDLPMAAWCLCPVASSLANGLGLYDGISQALVQTVAWGVPYLLGRLYLGSPDGFRLLATGVILGALVYVPLCLIEMRMSPQLHRLVYGYHQHEFLQTLRFGGYRPMVFMEHGLAVSLWMVSAALLALWLWWTGALPRLEWRPGRRLSMFLASGVLLVVAVLCKSTGALVLGVAGGAALVLTRLSRRSVVVAALLAVPLVYLAARASGAWGGEEAVQWVKTNVNEERAQSLEFRFSNEDALVEKTRERPVFGWGGWGRSHTLDDDGKDNTVTDSLWIIALSDRGFFGLVAIYAALLLPSARFVWVHSRWPFSQPALVAAAGGAVILALCTIDSLFNAQVNPVFILAAGSLAGLTGAALPQRAAAPPPANASPALRRPAWRRTRARPPALPGREQQPNGSEGVVTW
jgi:hypothetical protein